MFQYLIIFLVAVHGLNAAEIESRIVGGLNPNYPNSAKFIASLQTSSFQHKCGGAIIGTSWIVTSASCVKPISPQLKYIRIGSDYTATGGNTYEISSILPHQSYVDGTNVNDIAMVKALTYFVFNSNVQIISLPYYDIGGGYSVTLYGWGAATEGGAFSKSIKSLSLHSISNTECSQDVDEIIYYSHLCAAREFKGACQGDSGSPLVYGGYLHGIVGDDKSCGSRSINVFTRVTQFRYWIDNIINNN